MNLKQKLSSRKLWAMLAALAVSCIIAFGGDAGMIEHVVGVISALGACVAYIFAEACVDSSREERAATAALEKAEPPDGTHI